MKNKSYNLVFKFSYSNYFVKFTTTISSTLDHTGNSMLWEQSLDLFQCERERLTKAMTGNFQGILINIDTRHRQMVSNEKVCTTK